MPLALLAAIVDAHGSDSKVTQNKTRKFDSDYNVNSLREYSLSKNCSTYYQVDVFICAHVHFTKSTLSTSTIIS